MHISHGQGWLPRSIRYAFGEPIVELVKLQTRPPGFCSDMELRKHLQKKTIPLMDITVPQDRENGTVVDGFIFHLPRSGSTLVARMLATAGPCRVFVEPEAINALISHSDSSGPPHAAWLARLLTLYRLAYGEQSKVFIKLSSWSILWSDIFARASPDTPSCFVYRDPVEVLVQLLERPTGWMSENARGTILARISEGDDPLPGDAYTAFVLGHMIQAAVTSKLSALPVPYRQLPGIILDQLGPYFGVRIDRQAEIAILEQARYDSEDWSLSTHFIPDSGLLQERATPETRELVNTYISPYLELLNNSLSS
jgi:hypothetical protein